MLSEVAQVFILLVIIVRVLVDASLNHCNVIIGILNILVFAAFRVNTENLERSQVDVLSELPQSIREALSRFNLDSKTTVYAVCPKCHCTFSPTFRHGSATPIYQEYCSNHPTPGSGSCNEPLLKLSRSGAKLPIKPFVFHDFNDWFASLLSRPDLELAMNKACDDFVSAAQKPPPSCMKDIWDGDYVRDFMGPDGAKLFFDGGDEGRYGFTLNVDFFNIEGMTTRGRTLSCGIITMACINLPPELRYKSENMYVAGIIPNDGPTRTELNYYLCPIIDIFVISWSDGVRFSRTALHSDGHLCRYAVVAVVNDLPSARQTAAMASHSSHFFCSVCQCYHQSNLGRSDYAQWKLLDMQLLCTQAEKWRDASSIRERNDIFSSHGVRWSELWRLPYWNPVRQLIVDAMHGVLERVVHAHFREALELSSQAASSVVRPPPAFSHDFQQATTSVMVNGANMSRKEVKSVNKIHRYLTVPLEPDNAAKQRLKKRLNSCHEKALKFVCEDLGVSPSAQQGTGAPTNQRYLKSHWADVLLQWVCTIL